LKRIRRTFSLAHGEIVYVGDETRDLRAAQKAGIPSVGVTWGFNNKKSLAAFKPALLADEPKDLLQLTMRK
jgi:phosphoglycolate phosphatase